MLVVESTHICGFSPVCTTYCAWCMPCFCLSSWEFGLLPLHHSSTVLVSVCCRRSERLSSSPEDSVAADWLLRCSWSVCGTRGCVIATLFWPLASTDDACWQCFLCFVPFDALGLSSLCMYCSSVSSSLTPLPFAFYVSSLRYTPVQRIIFIPSRFHCRHSSNIFVTYVLPFCVSPRQPALVWMHNVKALHFNEQQLFKASFGGMIWLCMYRSFLTLVFSLCSSPQRSSFRIPSCELKGSSRCECVLRVLS